MRDESHNHRRPSIICHPERSEAVWRELFFLPRRKRFGESKKSAGLPFDLFQQRSKRIHRKMAGMDRSRRQPADSPHNFFAAQPAHFLHRFSLYQLGERRTTSHRGNASFRQKTDLHDLAVRDLHAQFQNIAASWILYLHRYVRIGNFARIPRMLEVIQKLERIHCKNCNPPLAEISCGQREL
jgi:hypothetical protein